MTVRNELAQCNHMFDWEELTSNDPRAAVVFYQATVGTCVRFCSLQAPTGEVIVLYKSLKAK